MEKSLSCDCEHRSKNWHFYELPGCWDSPKVLNTAKVLNHEDISLAGSEFLGKLFFCFSFYY